MRDRFIGYRGSQENEWSWEPERASGPGSDKKRGRRMVAFAALSAVAVLTVAVITTVVALEGGGGGGGGVVGATSSATPRATVQPTARPSGTPSALTAAPTMTAAATVTPMATPSPVPGTTAPVLQLLWWDPADGKWQSRDMTGGPLAYREGDVVPFLVRMSGVVAGQSYTLVFDAFDCGASPGKGFDYLTSVEAAGETLLLTAPGPGRTRPDAQVPIPNNPDIASDDLVRGTIRVWGGTFQAAPAWTEVPGSCEDDEQLRTVVLARASTLYAVVGGHLASPDEWPGGGAAKSSEPFGLSVMVNGLGARIRVAGSALSP